MRHVIMLAVLLGLAACKSNNPPPAPPPGGGSIHAPFVDINLPPPGPGR